MCLDPEAIVGEADRVRRARAFGMVAGEYERGRPGYPREAIHWILSSGSGLESELAGENGPLAVVDLGAGTGKLTRVLLDGGHRVWAVEPLAEMRAILAVSASEAAALEGSAEAIPLPDSSADAVLVGAAFHWFEHEPALAEISRVLRPEGTLGLLGNGLDESVPWIASLRERLGSRRPGERDRRWPEPARMEELFQSVAERDFPHVQPIDLAGLRDLAVSRSGVALMGPAERAEMLEELDALWRDQVGAERTGLEWRTRVLRAQGPR